MAEPFLSEIRFFGFGWAPRGWAKCDGQLLAIAQYQALFSLLGTTYGGDGKSTFGLPDLRGRTSIHRSTEHPRGQEGGGESVTLTEQTMAAHTHQWVATGATATRAGPRDRLLAHAEIPIYAGPQGLVSMAPKSLGPAGSGGAHPNVQPSLGVSACIALEGVYPSRS